MAAYRLSKKKKIECVGKEFFLVIPFEFRNSGILSPYWYIDYFMKHLERKYNMGLLTAALQIGIGFATLRLIMAIALPICKTSIQ